IGCDCKLKTMLTEFLRCGSFQLRAGTATAGREIGTREPADASQEREQQGCAIRSGARFDFVETTREYRCGDSRALDRAPGAMGHCRVNVFGARRFGWCKRAFDYAEAGVVNG